MTKTTKFTTSIMLIAVLSLLTTSLSYQPQEAFATVTSGTSTTGFQIVADPALAPINGQVGQDNQQNPTVFAFDEQIDLELPMAIDLDLSAMEGMTSVPAGTVVSSTTVVFDPVSSTSTQGCVEFAGQDVLGIQFSSSALIASDPILGHPDVTYNGPGFRGIEPPPHGNNDQVYFVGPKVCFILTASTPGDTFRVITVSDHVSTLLWQIGVFNNDRFDLTTSGTINEYDADLNSINNCNEVASSNCISPDFPALIGDRPTSPVGQTTNIDISFSLEESCSDAIFVYSRAGMETEQILLNGEVVETSSPIESQEFVWKTFYIPLGPLETGDNVITIDYIEESSPDRIHAVDALALVCWEPAIPPTEIVEIDVKPGSDPSSWNCKNTKGSMPVAVFGSESFDVQTINLDSLVFTYDGTSASVEEVHDEIHIEDKNGDEYPDGVLHLDSAGVCEATADAPLKETVEVTLSGTFGEDQDFEGLGDIRIVKNGAENENSQGKGKGKP